MLQRLGCDVTDCGIVPDQRVATELALSSASESHDLILTSGGVSVGEEDHIKPAVQALGPLDLWQNEYLNEDAPIIQRPNVPKRNDGHREIIETYTREKMAHYWET